MQHTAKNIPTKIKTNIKKKSKFAKKFSKSRLLTRRDTWQSSRLLCYIRNFREQCLWYSYCSTAEWKTSQSDPTRVCTDRCEYDKYPDSKKRFPCYKSLRRFWTHRLDNIRYGRYKIPADRTLARPIDTQYRRSLVCRYWDRNTRRSRNSRLRKAYTWSSCNRDCCSYLWDRSRIVRRIRRNRCRRLDCRRVFRACFEGSSPYRARKREQDIPENRRTSELEQWNSTRHS